MSTQSKSYLLVRLVLRSSTIFKKASFVLSSAGLKTGLPATRKPRLRRGGIVVLLDCAICGVCLCEESMVNGLTGNGADSYNEKRLLLFIIIYYSILTPFPPAQVVSS